MRRRQAGNPPDRTLGESEDTVQSLVQVWAITGQTRDAFASLLSERSQYRPRTGHRGAEKSSASFDLHAAIHRNGEAAVRLSRHILRCAPGNEVNEMPPSVTAPEEFPSPLQPAMGRRTRKQDPEECQALQNPAAPRGFDPGGSRDDLFLPGLNEPDPCITLRARNRRAANRPYAEKETSW
jgi:hypothetical protein